MNKFNKILIANRGEIAIRIMKTCKKMGISTIAVYSSVDSNSLHVKYADEAIFIGNASALESYLNMDNIINAALKCHADAIHPGYGFLSENPEFARRVVKAGIIFIGPSAETMHQLGNKKAVKIMLDSNDNVPKVPGYNGEKQDLEILSYHAKKIGFPILIKAASGGGGKGMRIVHNINDFEGALKSVKLEAKNSFDNDEVLLERYFVSVRHTEIQIFGDLYGNVVHYGERDCSLQRRYQKVIEEAPSPVVSNKLRERIGNAAVTIGKLANYCGAGTVEFLLDEEENFYFLEVNTRLQVEHPVTELIYGMDFVQLQIQIAQGYSLKDLKQLPSQRNKLNNNIPKNAIECRLYAEDPVNFFPCTGKLQRLNLCNTDGVRMDIGVTNGSEISVHYDPMVAKVITYGETRSIAIQRMIHALKQTAVLGVQTNQPFLLTLLKSEAFQSGKFDTRYIDTQLPVDIRSKMYQVKIESALLLSLAACIWDCKIRQSKHRHLRHITRTWSNNNGRPMQKSAFRVKNPSNDGDILIIVYYNVDRQNKYHMYLNMENELDHLCHKPNNNYIQHQVRIQNYNFQNGLLELEIDQHINMFHMAHLNEKWDVDDDELNIYAHHHDHGALELVRLSRFELANFVEPIEGQVTILAPLPCRVLELPIKSGELVLRGQCIAIVESMKMEQKIMAQCDGIVELNVKVGQILEAKQPILTVVPPT